MYNPWAIHSKGRVGGGMGSNVTQTGINYVFVFYPRIDL